MSGVVHQHLALSSFAGSQAFIDVNMARLGQLTNRARASEAAPTVAGQSTIRTDDERQGAWFSGIGGHTRFAGGNGDPRRGSTTTAMRSATTGRLAIT